MAAGKDGVQPGATWCRAECCLGALARFGQDGQVCILPFSVWLMLFFNGDLLQNCFWPSLPITPGQNDSYSWGEPEYRGRRALGWGMFCVWAARSQSVHAERQTCFSSQTSDAWQRDLSSTSVQVQPAFVCRPPPRPLFHTVGGFSPASELSVMALARGGMFEAIIQIIE